MQLFYTAGRAMLWGVSLLAVIILTAMGSAIFVAKLDDYRGSAYMQAAATARADISADVDRIGQIAESRTWSREVDGFVITDAAYAETNRLENIIEKKAEVVCSYNCVDTYDLPSIYKVTDGSQQKAFADRTYAQLTRLASPEHTREYNLTMAATHFASFATFIFAVYGFITLVLFKRLGWRKVLLNGLLVLPLLTLSTMAAFLELDGEYDYPKMETKAWVIPAFIIYLFVVYPPIITVAHKAGINVLDSLRVWRRPPPLRN